MRFSDLWSRNVVGKIEHSEAHFLDPDALHFSKTSIRQDEFRTSTGQAWDDLDRFGRGSLTERFGTNLVWDAFWIGSGHVQVGIGNLPANAANKDQIVDG